MADRKAVNPFKAPAPKGKNPGRIPKSEKYVDPRTASAGAPRVARGASAAVDPDEEARFSRGAEVPASNARNRLVSRAALSAARSRMTGDFPHEGDVDVEIDDQGDVRERRDGGDSTDDGDEAKVETVQRFTREDVESIVAEALRRERETHQIQPPAVADVSRKMMARTEAAVASSPAHPAMEFLPPRQPQQRAQPPARPALPEGAIAHPSGLVAMPVRVADVDRLWDWLRADSDKGAAFLGSPITTSVALHRRITFLAADAEREGVALLRSLYWQDQHFGFAMLAPILAEEQTALLHIYLMKDARGSLQKILQPLIDVAHLAAPDKHLAVASADATWARLHRTLLVPLGFVEHTMFVL